MKDPNLPTSDSRRTFLKDAVTTGSVAVAAAAAPGLAAAASAEVETPAQSQQEGYRLTQHVLDYYKSASA
ncbi:MAG: hypothetical protein KDJ27_18780 [Gammaproteobacteria bacterium]|nr:hypothetical protein [Gammaproteobacteria bacterium]MCB1925755.1 hypothetical protein [Gammaproteobacteria bacterium]